MKITIGKKLIFLISAVVILSVCINLISGCDNKQPGSVNEPNIAANRPASETGETEEPESGPAHYVADYLPDVSYGGYEFRIVSTSSGLFADYPEFWADTTEETGETVNDAIYKRNRLIEERYDIVFKEISVNDWPELQPLFKKSVTAGSDDFDLCMLISREAWATALTGAIFPLKDLPYLDMSQPWYAHDVNSQISINGKYYFAYSDECLNMFGQTLCVLFNKKITEELALDNMYNLVKENKWTTDKFYEFAKAAAKDLDGDGKMTKDDRYGIHSRNDMFFPYFWVGSGLKTVGKDENDLLVFIGDNQRLYDILEKTYQNIWGGETVYLEDATGDLFENNLALFRVNDICSIARYRGMEMDFGILPFPKNDESQEKYYTRVIDGWINCVPGYAPNTERTSIIMEALAVEAKNYTVPAYYEVALRAKHARDDESLEMLDIIHATRTVDLGDTFYYEPVRSTFSSVIDAKKNTFASSVEKNTARIQKALDKANEAALLLD